MVSPQLVSDTQRGGNADALLVGGQVWVEAGAAVGAKGIGWWQSVPVRVSLRVDAWTKRKLLCCTRREGMRLVSRHADADVPLAGTEVGVQAHDAVCAVWLNHSVAGVCCVSSVQVYGPHL